MKTALIFNPEIKKYSFGKNHPFNSKRFENFINFFHEKVPNYKKVFKEIKPEPATEEELKLVHDEEYINIIKEASKGIRIPNILEYVTADNLNPTTQYLPQGIHQASKIAVGTSLKAAELVFEEKFKKVIAIGGGLHHAKPSKGEGFCIYNDVAICARKLLKRGIKKILILDTDAHAGNGTAEIFYKDNKVLLIDFHQDPSTLYPGTGFIGQIGVGKGKGYTINIPLPSGAGDKSYEYSFKEIVFPVVKEFQPEVIIRNGGSDPYFADGLTNLALSIKGFKMIGKQVRKLAKEVCNEKEIDLIASGYNQKILPLAWSSLISGLINLEADLKEPKKTIFSIDSKLKETKEITKELKLNLKEYWNCFN